MPRFTPSIPCFAACVLLLTGIGGIESLPAEEDSAISVKMEDAVTYVMMAKVNLTVGKMTPTKGNLLGSYSINVPIKKSECETGQIVLPLLKSVEDYARNGGSISGKCTAEGKNAPPRKIKARFSAYNFEANEGQIGLTIDTGVRILEFKSTYHLSDGGLVVMN